MKSYLPLLAIALFFTSCAAYKSGQTPDDVYYSKPRQVDEYVRIDKKQNQQYQDPQQDRENEYLRLNIYDRRWSSILDDEYYNSYAYNPYSTYYNSYIGVNSPWNYYSYWNYHYNPYCNYYGSYYGGHYGGGVYTGYAISTPVYNKPRTTNLFVFNTPENNSSNKSYHNSGNSNYYNSNSNSSNNYRNSGTNAGNFLRNVFNNNNSSSNSGNTSRSSSSSSGSSSSGSSSSGSSGNAPVRKF